MAAVEPRAMHAHKKPGSPLKSSVHTQAFMAGNRTPSTSSMARSTEQGVSNEPIQTFLRIRPPLSEPDSESYIDVLSDTQVVMHVPSDTQLSKSRSRSTTAAPIKYTFSRVFAPLPHGSQNHAQAQRDFFTATTLPLVEDVLAGKNSLVFTYGVTNSGKTYTVQGPHRRGEAGILPRAIDVIFNSIAGRECTKAVRPVGLTGVNAGISDPSQSLLASRSRSRLKANHRNVMTLNSTREGEGAVDMDPTSVEVNPDYRYSVWVSYVEVYNEKLYDLLESPTQSLLTRPDRSENESTMPAPTRRPLLLKSEAESGGKYVGGLKEIKVSSIHEARELIRCGLENRSVFGTMANRSSSRSHSVFTIKILREHTGVDVPLNDVAGLSRKYSVSRLSIVDLAGSERISNTDISSGPRLKEAGSINKSLMCLGQCLETMRKNQTRAGISPSIPDGLSSSSGLHDAQRKRRQSIVPFRHSKLTELFQSFFMGDGKVRMIVNLNPTGTGYEENANVMRFSAMAKEVGIHVTSSAAPASDVSSSFVHETSVVELPHASDDEDDEEQDEFVNMLLAENQRLRLQCERAESACRIVEETVRSEMGQHLAATLQKMQRYYEHQLQAEMDASDAFMDRKIDLFTRLTQAVHDEPVSTNSSVSTEDKIMIPPNRILSESRNHINYTSEPSADSTAQRTSPKPKHAPTRASISAEESQDAIYLSEPSSPSKRYRKLCPKTAIHTDEMDMIAQDLNA
jgi:hypothetical protein